MYVLKLPRIIVQCALWVWPASRDKKKGIKPMSQKLPSISNRWTSVKRILPQHERSIITSIYCMYNHRTLILWVADLFECRFETMSQSVILIPHTVLLLVSAPPDRQSQEKNCISGALLVAQFFSCIYATTRCNSSFCCSPSSKVCVCVCKPDEVKGGSPLRTNLIFFHLSLFCMSRQAPV